jgi:hypothetical protein
MAKDLNTKVEEFAGRLEAALGDNLVSLLLYGPAVRVEGPNIPTTLLVVSDASPAALRCIEEHVGGWVKKGFPPPLIFSEREWGASSDVFPIEIEDMREAHRLLRGADPLQGIVTSKEDLRRELEREVRGKLLQLRTEFAATASDGKALGSLLVDSATTFFVLFRATLRLVGRTPPLESAELVKETADLADLDGTAFDWILGRLAGKKQPNLKPYDVTGDRYVEQIELLAHFVDSYETQMGNGSTESNE